MPWPTIITEAFELARAGGQTDESRFYGPFNMLLNHLFPFEDRYMVVPQWKRPEQSKSIDFTTTSGLFLSKLSLQITSGIILLVHWPTNR